MVQRMSEVLKEVTSFFRLEIQQSMRDFLHDHTNPLRAILHKHENWSTYRHPKLAMLHWKKEMNYEEVKAIQETCSEALKLWGYKEAVDKFDLYRFDPVLPLDLP